MTAAQVAAAAWPTAAHVLQVGSSVTVAQSGCSLRVQGWHLASVAAQDSVGPVVQSRVEQWRQTREQQWCQNHASAHASGVSLLLFLKPCADHHDPGGMWVDSSTAHTLPAC
jgi:hypothetical protein